MKRKRIAFIVNGGIGGGFGLEGNCWFIELCEELAKENDLTVFSLVNVVQTFHPKGYQLIGVPFEGYTNTIIRFSFLFYKIIRSHLHKDFQVIHGFWAYPSGLLALCVGKLFGIKTAITFAGGEVTNLPAIKYGLFRSKRSKALVKFAAKHVDILITPSRYQAEKVKKNVIFKEMRIISFGVDLTKFPVIDKPLQAPYQFIYLGDINKVKDLPTLIKAFKIISQSIEANLDVMGLDTLNGEIQTLVKKLELTNKVTFHGRQFNNQITFFLRKAHILLHTALSDAQIVAVNEAMASGVVVCGTRVGLIDDLDNKITTAVQVGDAELLAKQVLALLKDPIKYCEFRERGISWSQENDLIAQTKKYDQMYDNLLEGY